MAANAIMTGGVQAMAIAPDRGGMLAQLSSRRWERVFAVGGVWILPLPILLFVGLRAAGVAAGVCEDVVTLCVMVPLGGPHVAATLGRTLLNANFWRREPVLACASVLLVVAVIAIAVASAFFDLVIGGSPAMTWLLTGFFFWAGLHVVQQHCYVAACISDGAPGGERDRWSVVDHAVMLLALFPVALFRMSMAGDAAAGTADPDALATRLVYAFGASREFADDYVFRIGRAVPVLPDFLRGEVMWLAVTFAFAVAVALFVGRSLRARRRGTWGNRGRLVAAVAVTSSLAPLFPSLDVAFQGINAWHSFQYLGLSMLLYRAALARGDVRRSRLSELIRSGRTRFVYGLALGGTLLLVAAILGLGLLVEAASGGRFVMFGHDLPAVDAASGRVLYRPGSVLLAYYLLGFGLLLAHYLQDTVCFLRRRPLAASTPG